LLVLSHDARQLGVACDDQFHLFKAIGKLIVLLNVVFEDLFDLKPFFLFLLHEKFLPIKLLLQLFDLQIKRLLFLLRPLQPLLVDLVVEQDSAIEVFHVLVQSFVSFG
jgi:hypothetical protein